MVWSKWEPYQNRELKELIYEKKYRDTGGGVARITFNRPQRMNAMTNYGWEEIAFCVDEANLDPDIGVIYFIGAGPHFGVGGDVSWEAAGGLQSAGGAVLGVAEFDRAIANCLKPVIAAVSGYCIGGHNHLAYHCDFTIADETAVFGQNGPRVASPAHGEIVASLAHVVGMKRAKEMWMLCRQYTVQEALQMGLINAVVPKGKLEEEVDKWCAELLNISPTCLAIVKQSFSAIDHNLYFENDRVVKLIAPDFFQRPEVKEAQTAFFEKRTPNFWSQARKG